VPWTKVYIDKSDSLDDLTKEGLRGISYREALLEAQDQLLEGDQRVFLIGEGVDDPGGIFGSTLGLLDKYGKDRVMDIAIAENGITGVAIGAAIAGMRPIFVHMRMDFMPMCMDQIFNHAAKWYYMTGGKVNVPLIIRGIIGRGWGSAAQHSQALHSLFLHIPGLKVVAPSTPYDAKGLLIAAVRDGNPIIFVEHRWIYDYMGYVPEEQYTVPIGKGIVRREGRDITVVAISQMVYEAMKAAKELEADGIGLEIVDPRTLKPLDEEIIFDSVKKTGRLIIADVACKTGGVGAEIACRVSESVFKHLKAPIQRVNFPDVPTPCSPVLEEAYYPDFKDIIDAAKKVLGCV
jgi:pyruvate dehydrogenase E1 component beta subunit